VQCPAWIAPILAGGKDHKIPIRQKELLGKTPLRQILGIVGEVPAPQIDGLGAGIVDLDPVLLVPILIIQAPLIRGHELADAQTGLSPGNGTPGQHQEQQ
jgi:hypothetical protein